MAEWAIKLRYQKENGIKTKEFCTNEGIHENTYYYWQRKLRDAASEELARNQLIHSQTLSPGFMEVKLPPSEVKHPTIRETPRHGQINIEVSGLRITADNEYPVHKLAELLREVIRP
jgi:hypothetical protein